MTRQPPPISAVDNETIPCRLHRATAIRLLAALLVLLDTDPASTQIVESGLGTSSLFHLDASGNSGRVLSRRVFGSRGGLEPVYAIDGAQEHAYIAKGADVDGDGMDDIALVRGNRTQTGAYLSSVLSIYDGFSGQELYSYALSDSSRNASVLSAIVDDFDGDGREEFVFVLRDEDLNAAADFTYIDPYEKTVRAKFLPGLGPFSPRPAVQFCSGDFDGDNRDDLGLAYLDTEDDSARVVVKGFDVQRETLIVTAELPAPGPGWQGTVQLHAADVHGKGRSSLVALVTAQRLGGPAAPRRRLFLVKADGTWDLAYDTNDSGAIGLGPLVFADLSGDGSEDVVVIASIPHEHGHHSTVTAIDVPNGSRRILYSTPPIAGQISRIYLGLGMDLDRNGQDGIVVVESSSSPSGAQSNPKLSALSGGGRIEYTYRPAAGDPQWIREVFSGDFDNDSKTDLLIVHGTDLPASTAPATAVLINNRGTVTDRLELSSAPGDQLLPLTNEITDSELLRAINMDTRRHDLGNLKSLFAAGRTAAAITELFHFFKERGGIENINLELKDWYYGDETDFFVSNIRRISTAAAKEHPCLNCLDNVFRLPTAAGRRTGRVLSTLLHRLETDARLDERVFATALKALSAQLVWKSREGNATNANNHGTLFELDSFLPTAIALSMFKAYDAPHQRNWLEVIDQRLGFQIDHVFADGVHDEHSFYYAYRISSSFNKFLAMLASNAAKIALHPQRISQLKNAIARLNEYMIYAVKPIEPKLDEEKVYTASDIPVIGDTKGIWVRAFGKQPEKKGYESFLKEPIALGHTQYWDDRELAEILSFVADPRHKRSFTFDLPATRFFAESGIFISRSNWLTANGSFDYAARYAYFRGGEMIPTPGPYWGYRTWSHHAHADLLSVELSGYNDNLIVESSGLVVPDNLDVIDNFDRKRYTELYGYESEFDNFLTARHYFKGTAAHNTVYVNKKDQATFEDNFRWLGIGNLKALETYHIVADELDHYSAAIENEDYAHRRAMYYVKPQIDNRRADDYWFFVDKVAVHGRTGVNRVEQIWHVSPSQQLRDVNLELARIGTDNMVVVQARHKNAAPLQTEIVDTYNLTDFLRIDAKAIKFAYDQSAAADFVFATAILPFGEGEIIAHVHLDELEINDFNRFAEQPGARAFRLRFSRTSTQGKVRRVEDHIFISNTPNGLYSWSPGRRGTNSVTTNKKFELHRRIDGEHAKTIVVAWDGTPYFDVETVAGEFAHAVPRTTALGQNYPNPFNATTAIRFTMSQREFVDLSLFSLSGQKVSSLARGFHAAGTHTVRWFGRDDRGRTLASGVYLYRLSVGDWSQTKKLILIQ